MVTLSQSRKNWSDTRGTDKFPHSPTGWVSPDGTVSEPLHAEHWWTLQRAGYQEGIEPALEDGWIRYAFRGPDWMAIEGNLDSLERNKPQLEDLAFRYLKVNPTLDPSYPYGAGKIEVDVRHVGGFSVTLEEFVDRSIQSNINSTVVVRRIDNEHRPVRAYRRSK